MPAKVFQTADRRHLARALSEGLTHGALDIFEGGLGIKTGHLGNKDQRAGAIVRHLFEEVADTDGAVLELLDYLYFDDDGRRTRREAPAYRAVERAVLVPRGIVQTDDGFRLPNQEMTTRTPSSTIAPDVPPPVTITHSASTGDAFTNSSRAVFIVHGRDLGPVHALEQFLRFVGLHGMSWSEARALTGNPQPSTYDIVHAGIAAAAAVIVVFSPDDEARLRPSLAAGEEPEPLTGQPRQNVILEAGLAFGMAPRKTVFVKSGRTRSISDIDGFNWVTLDGRYDSRRDLLQRLRDAGAPVSHDPGNLMDDLAGPFQVV